MKKEITQEQFEARKRLIRQLLMIQYEFEHSTNRYDLNALMIISMIDKIMESILEECAD